MDLESREIELIEIVLWILVYGDRELLFLLSEKVPVTTGSAP